MQLSRYRVFLRLLLALAFITAGILHFVKTPLYVSIMPPYLPYALELVYISGVFEILGGIGVLIASLRPYAGIGLIALVIAVTPANVQMFINYFQSEGWSGFTVLLTLRLPLQLLIILWIYWCSLSAQARAET